MPDFIVRVDEDVDATYIARGMYESELRLIFSEGGRIREALENGKLEQIEFQSYNARIREIQPG